MPRPDDSMAVFEPATAAATALPSAAAACSAMPTVVAAPASSAATAATAGPAGSAGPVLLASVPGSRGAAGLHWPGVLLSVVVAIAATFIAETRGGPTMLYALLIGMALHSAVNNGPAAPGIGLSARAILRLGVALLGVRITLGEIGDLGWFNGSLIVGCVLATIAFGLAMGRVLGLSVRFGMLTGGATAICGASAAIAIATVLPRDEDSERELIFTIAGVTALSTLAMVLYPLIVKAMGLDAHAAGIFLGGTIHDVAQVVGAGYSISHDVGDYAVLTKMLRVAMLLPVVMALSLALSLAAARRGQRSGAGQRGEKTEGAPLLPSFLLGFVALVAIGSMGWIPAPVGQVLNELSRACLVVAISAVGLKTSLMEIKTVGARAMLLLGAEALFLVGFVLLIQKFH